MFKIWWVLHNNSVIKFYKKQQQLAKRTGILVTKFNNYYEMIIIVRKHVQKLF